MPPTNKPEAWVSNDNEKNVKHLLYMEDFKLYTANHDQVEEALDVQRGHQEGVQNGQVFYRHHQKRQTFKRNSCALRKISSRLYQKGLQISGDLSKNTMIKKKNWSRSTDLKLEITPVMRFSSQECKARSLSCATYQIRPIEQLQRNDQISSSAIRRNMTFHKDAIISHNKVEKLAKYKDH